MTRTTTNSGGTSGGATMATYTIDIVRTSMISVDVEANSVEEAVGKVYDVMTPHDYHDSDDEIKEVRDSDGNEYYRRHNGEWIRDILR
jgi:hypothetical protein